MAQERREASTEGQEGVASNELLPKRVVDLLFDIELLEEMRRKNAGGKPLTLN